MEPFENMDSELPVERPEPAQEAPVPEPIPEIPEEPAQVREEPVRRHSPYENSPYEMNSTAAAPKMQKGKKEKCPRRPIWKRLLSVLLTAVLVAGACGVTAYMVNESWAQRSERQISALRQEMAQMKTQLDAATATAAAALPKPGTDMTPAQIYAANVNSVVAISVTVPSYGGQGLSAGSGFIFREDGYMITNRHVVEGATSITVTVNDGTQYPAQLVGMDANNDLAVLKVEATGLQAAVLGSSNELAIGDMVVAIGNALGELSATQTVGYVSGINREVSTGSLTTISMIQTDAAINPGNSGGPLFNMYGQVIGITTAKYSGTTDSGASIEGIGFAIPIDDVIPMIQDLIDFGYVTGAYMAVTVQDTDPQSAAQFGLPTGAYIVSVEEGGAADRAGIQPKDIVIALDSYTVSNVTDLTRALRNYKAGDTAEVTVLRSGKELTLTITLDERPQETAVPETTPQESPSEPTPEDYEAMFDYFFRRYFG